MFAELKLIRRNFRRSTTCILASTRTSIEMGEFLVSNELLPLLIPVAVVSCFTITSRDIVVLIFFGLDILNWALKVTAELVHKES